MSLAPGTRLGPYEVVALLGAGGMGEVWRARDTRVGRAVALKVLPEDFLEDEEKKLRFEREARSLAALNHPNIVALHSFEEIGSRHVLVMELVEGTTLRDVLDSGPIPGKQAVDFAQQIARGLSAAHEKGIVHRDLKPENVLVTKDGRIKILDFGLAKRTDVEPPGAGTSTPTASKYTEPGVVMGTVGYMSPEQARGLPMDRRTDVWAFGCILYEMLAGRRAFTGETRSDTLAAILRGEADFSRLPTGTSPRAVSLIGRTLQKDPDQRLRDIADAQPDLEEAQVGAASKRSVLVLVAAAAALLILAGGSLVLFSRRRPPPPPASLAPSIAVLPFTNLSGDKEQEYFSDGLSEELMGLLTKVKGLHVTGRTSSFAFKGKTDDLRTIAQKLNVATVLEGSVRRAGDRMRVSTRLVNTADGYQLWAETFDRKMTDVFEVQDEIAGAVVAALKVELLPQERNATALHRSSNPEAYNQFLMGRQFYNRQNKDGYIRGREAFRKAVALDPAFAAAYAGLAPAESLAAEFGAATAEERDEGRQRALKIADRAVALDPGLAEAYSSRGFLRFDTRWEWAGATSDLEKSLALDPADSNAQRWYGMLLASLGRLDEAADSMKKAAELDPLNGQALYRLGTYLNASGRLAEARSTLDRALEVNPESAWVPYHLGMTSLLERRPAATLKEVEKAQEDWRLAGLALAHYDLGNAAESQRQLDSLVAKFATRSAYHIAEVHAWRGEKDKAFEWLERAYAQRNRYLTWVKFDPLLVKLHDDPRYASLLKKLNLPVEN